MTRRAAGRDFRVAQVPLGRLGRLGRRRRARGGGGERAAGGAGLGPGPPPPARPTETDSDGELGCRAPPEMLSESSIRVAIRVSYPSLRVSSLFGPSSESPIRDFSPDIRVSSHSENSSESPVRTAGRTPSAWRSAESESPSIRVADPGHLSESRIRVTRAVANPSHPVRATRAERDSDEGLG